MELVVNRFELPPHRLLSVRCREAAAGRGTGRDRAARAGGGGEVSERQAGTTCMACMHACGAQRLRSKDAATAQKLLVFCHSSASSWAMEFLVPAVARLAESREAISGSD